MIVVCVAVILLLVPFEPRYTVPLGFIRLSLIEAVAIPCFTVLAVRTRDRALRFDLPVLGALGLMAVLSLVSAAFAEPEPTRAFKFALRLVAMAAFAFLVSRLNDREITSGMRALLVSGGCAAALALAEGLGVRSLDVVLGAFREIPFNVAGVRRASAGSEYPNLGAGMILYALLCGVTLLRARTWVRAALVLIFTSGLAFTYSRGAWLAGLAGLAVAARFERGRARFAPLGLYIAVLGAFVLGKEISQIRLGGENANDFYAAVYKTPKQIAMDASARTIVPVEVRNVGRRPWRKADEIHLSYHLYQDASRPLIDGPRTDLPQDVLPGESVTMEAILRAPRNPGEYVLMWDLVHEDTTWFSGQGVAPGVVRLIVGRASDVAEVPSPPGERPLEAAGPRSGGGPHQAAPALKAIPEPLAWRPSRLELWSVALLIWKSHPFLGVGPDNYRWTYGVVAGKPTFDTRVFANNMYLEYLATLGSLGFAAFGVALVFAIRLGWKRASEESTTLIALSILIAMSVHGLADYLLAFTGHYLVFGFALGVLARSWEAEHRRSPLVAPLPQQERNRLSERETQQKSEEA
jgi:O-antigen ligase